MRTNTKKKFVSARKRKIVVDLCSSSSSSSQEEEEDEEEHQEQDQQEKFAVLNTIPRQRNPFDNRILDPVNWRKGMYDTITGVDPGSRNFSPCTYSIRDDRILDWDWVDFQGVNKSKRTSKQIIEQLKMYIDTHPTFFEQADLIVVEVQMLINPKNVAIKNYIMERFSHKCIECYPKMVKSVMNKWVSLPTAQRNLKKKTTVEFGKVILNAQEKQLFESLMIGRKMLQNKITEHDKKMIKQGRIKIKRPRRINVLPADVFDAMMIAFCVACELMNQDIVEERLRRMERKRKRESIENWLC